MESCADVPDCKEQGWGILQLAKVAIQYAESLADEAFTSAGDNGHSLPNTIWYYATRPSTYPSIALLILEHFLYNGQKYPNIILKLPIVESKKSVFLDVGL